MFRNIYRKKPVIKKRHQHKCFPRNIAKLLGTPILKTSASGCFSDCSHSEALRSLFHIEGAKFFKKGQFQGHLKLHKLEQSPG